MAGFAAILNDEIDALAVDPALLGLFVLLVRRASWDGGIAPKGSVLAPGQLVTSRRELARLTGQSESWCHRAIERLAAGGFIVVEKNREGSLVTIGDWDLRRPPKKLRTTDRTKSEPQTDRESNRNVNHKVNHQNGTNRTAKQVANSESVRCNEPPNEPPNEPGSEPQTEPKSNREVNTYKLNNLNLKGGEVDPSLDRSW